MWLQPRRRVPQKRLTGLKCVACTNTSWTFKGGFQYENWVISTLRLVWILNYTLIHNHWYIITLLGTKNVRYFEPCHQELEYVRFQDWYILQKSIQPNHGKSAIFRILLNRSALLEASWYFVQYQSTAAVVEAAYGVYRQFGPIPPYLDLPFKLLRR